MLFQRNIILGLIVGLFTLNSAQAIDITSSNKWETCQLQDNISNAGDYYASNLESLTLNCADADLSISGATTSTTAWTVTSRLANSLSGMNLDLLRIGNGSGGSIPTGAGSYITQTTAAQILFTGQGNISQVPLVFRIRNFDVHDGNGTKNIQLIYEITTN